MQISLTLLAYNYVCFSSIIEYKQLLKEGETHFLFQCLRLLVNSGTNKILIWKTCINCMVMTDRVRFMHLILNQNLLMTDYGNISHYDTAETTTK